MNISIETIMNIIIMLIILTILVVIHEWGHIRATRKHGGYVPEFAVGFFPGSRSLIKWTSQKTKTTYHLKPWLLGGYIVPADEDYTGDMYGKKQFKDFKYYQKIHVLVNGVLYNFYFAFLILVPFFMYVGVPSVQQIKISTVAQNSPALKAGIKPDDIILKVDDQQVDEGNIKQILENNQPLINKTSPTTVTVERNGEIQKITVTPEVKDQRPIIGVTIQPEKMVVSHSFTSAFGEFFRIIQKNIQAVAQIFSFQKNGEEVQSIVGATASIGEVANKIESPAAKAQFYLSIMGSISVGLMIFNLLPIPALDGGQILIVTYERIRKKQIAKQQKDKILTYSFIGLMIFGIGLMLRDTINLIIQNLFGG